MTRSAPPSLEQLEALWRPAADEVNELLENLVHSDFTAYEMAGLLAILRVVMDRVDGHRPGAAAPVVKLSLIREAKSGRVKR
jgi:hypothetical protein